MTNKPVRRRVIGRWSDMPYGWHQLQLPPACYKLQLMMASHLHEHGKADPKPWRKAYEVIKTQLQANFLSNISASDFSRLHASKVGARNVG